MKISFRLNNKEQTIEVEPEERLLDVLRNNFGATGVKESCGEGECGSCTVLLNGKTVLACLTPMIKVNGAEIITIEGLSKEGTPSYVQRAFIDAGAVQCGFCTPGLVMSVANYVENEGTNNRDSIKRAISGNLCRCTGYSKVIQAVELAIEYKNENSSDK